MDIRAGRVDPAIADLSVVPVDKVRGSSFYTAMRILPAAQRLGMYEIYAFCRAVDDIADGGEERAVRLRRLDAWREALARCYRGAAPLELKGLAQQIAAFGLCEEDFLAVIAGMQMDAERDIVAPSREELDLFCDRVASAVGRLSVRVFGLDEAHGVALAHHLGRGLQLTNILRDLDEDASQGRLYLPAEELAAAGISLSTPVAMLADSRIDLVCRALAVVAQQHLDESTRIMRACPARYVRAPRIMAGAYQSILRRLRERGYKAPRARVGVNRLALLGTILRYGFI